MNQTQQDYAAAQYSPRAADYVTSAVHAAGPGSGPDGSAAGRAVRSNRAGSGLRRRACKLPGR